MEAKDMLKRLQVSGYGEFPDGQLRTLQRRVRVWRMRVVQQLVYGVDQNPMYSRLQMERGEGQSAPARIS